MDLKLKKGQYYQVPRYQILIEYAGSNFRGWQIQKKDKTVQGLIQEKVSKILKEKIIVYGAGRLDSGVHAIGQSAHFDCLTKIEKKDSFLKSINFFLKKENVSILSIKKRNRNFHARHSAKMRVYNYKIINRLSIPVLQKNRSWHVIKKLNLNLMKEGAKILIGNKDFSTFRASSCRAKSPIKTLKLVKIISSKDIIDIEFRSQSFLQQQVRSMVGCLKFLGEKKWSLKKFDDVTKSKKRTLCAPPAPPEGLYLTKVIY